MSRIEEKKCNLFSAACEDRKVTPQGTVSFVFGNRSLDACLHAEKSLTGQARGNYLSTVKSE